MSQKVPNNLESVCKELRKKLKEAVLSKSFDCSLLSGGLDSSIISYIASEERDDLESISVGFEESPMEDLKYVRKLAEKLEIETHVYKFDFPEIERIVRKVIPIIGSFDPIEIRNDIPIYLAFEKANEMGLKNMLTGDGSDELFAGYSFLYKLPSQEMRKELEKIWKIMSFSSQKIGKELGTKANLPYLDEKFTNFAKNIPLELKVGLKKKELFGKWVLRKAYEKNLPDDIIWREKTPIETGTGTTILPKKFKELTGEKYFQSKRDEIRDEEKVTIRSAEQLFYYRIYKSSFGIPEPENPDGRTCPYCGVNISPKASFCRTCGSGWEVNQKS